MSTMTMVKDFGGNVSYLCEFEICAKEYEVVFDRS